MGPGEAPQPLAAQAKLAAGGGGPGDGDLGPGVQAVEEVAQPQHRGLDGDVGPQAHRLGRQAGCGRGRDEAGDQRQRQQAEEDSMHLGSPA